MTEGTTARATTLKVLFWCSLGAEVAWLTLSASAWEAVTSVLGVKGLGLVHLIILGALALFSGLLVVLERRANTATEPERQWTPSELLYALMLFFSLFIGIWTFLGIYYSS